ncbi:hypothetical protein [Methyloglobulus sp.]|uniref:hypothetical protein n=1 Tax=Methyloglobulus sp. TaxID=2518622 RepID=UPI0032B86390
MDLLFSLVPKLCLGMLFYKLELALSVPNLEIGNWRDFFKSGGHKKSPTPAITGMGLWVLP